MSGPGSHGDPGLVAAEIRNCRLKDCRWRIVTEWRSIADPLQGKRMNPKTVERVFHEHIKSHTREEQSRIFSIEEGRV